MILGPNAARCCWIGLILAKFMARHFSKSPEAWCGSKRFGDIDGLPQVAWRAMMRELALGRRRTAGVLVATAGAAATNVSVTWSR